MDLLDVDALLDRHRDRFRKLLQVIAAEEQGEDPFRYPLARYRALADEQKFQLVRRAAIIAAERVRHELKQRGAAWVVLVGDDVVLASDDPVAVPSPEDVLRLGEPRGLVAYLFEAPMVEEVSSVSRWSPLRGNDRYPTVPLVLRSAAGSRGSLMADLDTGSHVTFLDADLVEETAATWFTGEHLGSRRALVGRDFLRALSLSLVLRAPDAETEVLDAAPRS